MKRFLAVLLVAAFIAIIVAQEAMAWNIFCSTRGYYGGYSVDRGWNGKCGPYGCGGPLVTTTTPPPPIYPQGTKPKLQSQKPGYRCNAWNSDPDRGNIFVSCRQ